MTHKQPTHNGIHSHAWINNLVNHMHISGSFYWVIPFSVTPAAWMMNLQIMQAGLHIKEAILIHAVTGKHGHTYSHIEAEAYTELSCAHKSQYRTLWNGNDAPHHIIHSVNITCRGFGFDNCAAGRVRLLHLCVRMQEHCSPTQTLHQRFYAKYNAQDMVLKRKPDTWVDTVLQKVAFSDCQTRLVISWITK